MWQESEVAAPVSDDGVLIGCVLGDASSDQEAIATILRITKGNLRLIERLMMQVELVLVGHLPTPMAM